MRYQKIKTHYILFFKFYCFSLFFFVVFFLLRFLFERTNVTLRRAMSTMTAVPSLHFVTSSGQYDAGMHWGWAGKMDCLIVFLPTEGPFGIIFPRVL